MMRIYQWLLLAVGLGVFGSARADVETLRILCWEGYAEPEYTQPFEAMIKEKYGIDLKVVVESISDPEEFFRETQRKHADLISPAHNIPKSERWRLIQRGIVLPVNLDNIPNYQHLIPDLQRAEYITDNDKVYGVPIVYGPYGLMYNTAIVKEAPQSWQIFWDPQYAGQYAISKDYHEANIFFTGLALGLDKQQIFSYDTLKQESKFMTRLAQLVSNAKLFWVGVDSADDLQGLAFATGWGFALPELKKRGETWKMANPQEGTTGWVDNWMIGHSLQDKPQLKRIAEEWINYSISPEVQMGYVRNIAQFPVNLAVKDRLTAEEIAQFHLDDADYFKNNLILWKVMSMDDQNGLAYLWGQIERYVK